MASAADTAAVRRACQTRALSAHRWLHGKDGGHARRAMLVEREVVGGAHPDMQSTREGTAELWVLARQAVQGGAGERRLTLDTALLNHRRAAAQDITVVVTYDVTRLYMLDGLCLAWGGAISAAVYQVSPFRPHRQPHLPGDPSAVRGMGSLLLSFMAKQTWYVVRYIPGRSAGKEARRWAMAATASCPQTARPGTPPHVPSATTSPPSPTSAGVSTLTYTAVGRRVSGQRAGPQPVDDSVFEGEGGPGRKDEPLRDARYRATDLHTRWGPHRPIAPPRPRPGAAARPVPGGVEGPAG